MEGIRQNPVIFGVETPTGGTPNPDSSSNMAATITKLTKELKEAKTELTQSGKREEYLKSEKKILESRIASL